MKTLIVGAGGTGGYFGGRLAQAGRDVTFLVRDRRAEQLAGGLRIFGVGGDETVPVRTVIAGQLEGSYDLIIVAVKAGALPVVLEQIAPVVGPDTLILPFLNGMAHLQMLNDRFGPAAVLGGIVRVVTTVTADGEIHQMKPIATMTLGPQTGAITERLRRVHQELSVPGYSTTLTGDIVASMWHKWAFITAAGVITCLMRGPIGAILAAPGGEEFIREVIAETELVVADAGYPLTAEAHAASVEMLAEPGSVFTSSLYRDVTAGLPHEGEHLLGHFVTTAQDLGLSVPLTALALLQLRTHDQTMA